MNICIFGAASPMIDQKYTDAAYAVGAELAACGHTMIFGGGGTGMMGAAARGCSEKQGRIIGILPEFFKASSYEVLFEDAHETIYTVDIAERINLMEDMSDGFIVLPGGVGTYEEFIKILVSVCLDRHKKPLAVLNIDSHFDLLKQMLEEGVTKGFISADRMEKFRIFDGEHIPEMIAYVSGNGQDS